MASRAAVRYRTVAVATLMGTLVGSASPAAMAATFALLEGGGCYTEAANEVDVLTYWAADLSVCQTLCHVEAFPCTAVSFAAERNRCRVHYAPVARVDLARPRAECHRVVRR